MRALEARGWRPLRCARTAGEITGFDAADPAWQREACWKSALASAGCTPDELSGVVNLVAARRGGKVALEAGCGAIRATAVLAALGHMVTTVHLGSVAEFRQGRQSPYGAAKRAARAEAKARRLSVIITVGVVPRPVGDPHDVLLRWLASRIPAVAALRIDVVTPEQVGDAAAVAMDIDWLSTTGGHTAEVTLAGTPQTLGNILGVPGAGERPRWYSTALLSLLAHLPVPPGVQLARAISVARQAAGRSASHYRTEPPDDVPVTAVVQGWCLTGSASADLWLVPHTSSGTDEAA